MNTTIIIIVLLVIIVIILVYFVLQNAASIIPLPNSLPMTTNQALATHNQVPIEVLAPEYPLDEEYYYNPA